MDKHTLKKDQYDILIDLIQHGIDKYGGVREQSFAGRYDGVYILDFYKRVDPKPENSDSAKEQKESKI